MGILAVMLNVKYNLKILAIQTGVTSKKVKYSITISTSISEVAYFTTMLIIQSKYYTGTLLRKSAPTLSLPLMCSTLKTKLCRANTQRMI